MLDSELKNTRLTSETSGSLRHARETRSIPGGRRMLVSMCGICPAGCGVNAHLVDGVLEKITPLRGHPLGFVCARGARAPEVVYSPDRLLHPQRRKGPRGQGAFERVTWDNAFRDIVGNLHRIAIRHGPEAVAIYTGRGNFEFGLNETFAPAGTVESSANTLLFPFGSPNSTGVGALCYAAYGMIATHACFGGYMREMHVDIEQAELVLVWGANPATDSPPVNLRRLRRALRRGARVIVIDHRRSETVRALGTEWLGIRPGTDGALALALMQVLVSEGLYEREFVAHWSHGFDELDAYLHDYTPERVEGLTRVPADRIRALARAVGTTRACAVLMYSGLEYSNCGVQAIRAVWSLQALAGHLDIPGGNQFKMPGRARTQRLLTAPPDGACKPIGADEYPLYRELRHEAHAALLPQAILEGNPYPVRGLIIGGSSIITAWPNPELWRRALAALDYLVVIDRFPTADSLYADIVLPATTGFETESYMIYDGGLLQLRRRVIPPRGEARNDYLIYAELASRLGYGHLWPQSEESMIEHALEGTGVTLEELRASSEGVWLSMPEKRFRQYERGELRADGRPGFETPTGKFEFASEWLRQRGYPALPEYTEPEEGPLASQQLAERFPLVFNSGARTQYGFRSQHYNIPGLVGKHPAPLVYLHARDAQPRGITNGDPVYVTSPRGKIPCEARVSENILPGVVEVNMGGGGPVAAAEWKRGNVNELTDFDNRDPISGFPVFKALLCDVQPRGDEPKSRGA
jgi:anaerobic selenocysteine-containing dehydrogenase